MAIRRATADDVEFLAGLVTDDEVAPFLAAGLKAPLGDARKLELVAGD